jgi:ABC-2 type transport system ATP-binding protein
MTVRADAPVVIEVRGLEKTFRIPPRSRHPRFLRALRGVSFEVRRGEFFGVVGRNGSGKSTLLKVLASIYRADAGRIRMAGRLAPFIELGVGFNPELTARENVALNGVMMGLGRREAARRLDAVLAFAELEEFVDLKLKNYSSGMLVRLGFSVMVETDADIMLVDEVLAVGDAAFAQRCMDVFRAKRAAGRTLVLVTHDMSTVQAFCDRAMLLHEGEVRYLGDPEEAALRYYRLNFSAGGDDVAGEMPARVLDAWLQDEAGERVESVQERAPIAFGAVVEAHQDLGAPTIGFQVLNRDGVVVLGFGAAASPGDGGAPRPLAAGERVRVTGRIDNPLLPGRYALSCSMARDGAPGDLALRVPQLVEFEVRPAPWRAGGGDAELGMVAVREDVRAVLEG